MIHSLVSATSTTNTFRTMPSMITGTRTGIVFFSMSIFINRFIYFSGSKSSTTGQARVRDISISISIS